MDVKDVISGIQCDYILLGSDQRQFDSVMPLDIATEGSLSYCVAKVADPRSALEGTGSKLIIAPNKFADVCKGIPDKTFILVDDPKLAFIRCMSKYFDKRKVTGIHESVTIGKGCTIGHDPSIGPYSTIGDEVVIGDGVSIGSGVHIGDRIKIGDNVRIHSGVDIGVDGFGFVRDADGRIVKFPQIGGVVIHDDVEIGANTCIARGTMADTVIGERTKVDNLVHIAHNVVIGKDCLIIAQAMIGGSAKIGDRCWISPCSCIRNGISIGNDALVGMGSVVTKDVADGDIVLGVPARSKRAVNDQ